MILCLGIRCNSHKVIFVDDTHSPALHLLEKTTGFYTAHEHHNFQGLDVRASGDHVHCHGNPGMIAVSKFCNQIFRFFAGCLVGNLLGKLIAL